MKTLKKLAFILTIVIATTFISSAQPQRDEHPRELPNAEQIEKMVEHMAIDLSLSEEQKTKINALYEAHFNELKVKRDEEEAKLEEIKKSHDNFRDEFFSSVKAELDAEQAKEFDAFNEKHHDQKEKRENDGPHRRG